MCVLQTACFYNIEPLCPRAQTASSSGSALGAASSPSANGCRRPRSNGNGIGNQRSQQHGTEIAIECKLLDSKQCRQRGGGGCGELVKQARYIAKKFTTSVGQLIEPLSRGLNSMIFFCKYFIGCMAGNLAEICVPGTGTGQGICMYAVAALKWA